MFKLKDLFHKHDKVITNKQLVRSYEIKHRQIVERSYLVTVFLVNGYCSKCGKHLYWVEKERNEIILH